jgi:hypothetical protein
MSEHSKRSRIPTGGLVLVALGALLLLQTTGVVAWGVWGALWRLWPVLILITGVQLVLGRRAPLVAGAIVAALLAGAVALAVLIGPSTADVRTVHFTEQVGIVPPTRMDVEVDFGAGSLRLDALPEGSPLLAQATLAMPGREAIAAVERIGGTATLRFSPGEGGFFALPFGWGDDDADWDIALAPGTVTTLDLDIGAADADVDLSELAVERLEVSVGAADVDITLPASGRVTAAVSGGAADITITIPEGVAARISASSGLSSVSINEERFPKAGDVWESAGYATAQDRVDLSISVGAASVNVR